MKDNNVNEWMNYTMMAGQKQSLDKIARELEKKNLLDAGMLDEYKKLVEEEIKLEAQQRKTSYISLIIALVFGLAFMGLSFGYFNF